MCFRVKCCPLFEMQPNRRMRMKQWLTIRLDGADTPGIQWEDREQNIFRINWKHGSRHGYSPERDAVVFRRWAEYTGKLDARSPDPKRWKANFRCALNSLKDVKQLNDKKFNRGVHAFRLYQFVEHSGRSSRRQPMRTQATEAGSRHSHKMAVTVVKQEPCEPSSVINCLLTPPRTPEDYLLSIDTQEYKVTRSIQEFHLMADQQEGGAVEVKWEPPDMDIIDNCTKVLSTFNGFPDFELDEPLESESDYMFANVP